MLSVALLIAALLAQQQPPSPAELQRMRDAVMKPIVLQLPGMERVRVRKDIVYRTDAGQQLLADIYTPPNTAPSKGFPVVFFLHGGVPDNAPLAPKDWGFYQGWGRLAGASGWIGVAFNQRTSFPEPRMTAAAADVAAMLDYVRQHAAELHADPDRVCLIAFSAGGPLSPALRGEVRGVRCVLSFYALLDPAGNEFHQRYDTPEELARYSPLAALRSVQGKTPPLFVARAGRDQIPGFNDAMQRFLNAAVELNAPLTLMIHPAGVHGFDNQNDDDRSREILRAAFAFMKQHLEAP